MKRRTILIIMSMVLLTVFSQVPAYARELANFSGSGDKVSIMGDIKIDRKTSGTVVAIIGNADVREDVNGDVVAIFGDVTVNAKVSGEIVSIFGKVKLEDAAEVGGEVVAVGSIERSPGAKIHGQEVAVNIDVKGISILAVALLIVLSFVYIVFGLIVLAIMKERYQNMSLGIEENIGRKLAVGFLGLVGSTVLSLLLSITVIIPIVYLIFVLLAEIAATIYFGKLILKVFNSGLNVFLEFITGIIFLTAVEFIIIFMIPFLGFGFSVFLYAAANLFILSIGAGILIDTRVGTQNYKNNLTRPGFGYKDTSLDEKTVFDEDFNPGGNDSL